MAKQTLESWIQEALTDDDKDGRCTMIALMHMIGPAEREVHTVKFGGKQWTARDLGQLFRHKAESYSQDIAGVQHFCILAFYGGRPEPEARHPFVIQGETDYGGLATEGPNASGLTQQAMRHAEAVMQLAFRQTSNLFTAQNETMHLMAQQNAKLMSENHDALEVVKQLMMEKITRSGEVDKARLAAEERNRWLAMAPPLINSIFGRNVFPQETADSSLLNAIAESMNPDTIGKLAAAIPPELWGPLASRLTDVFQKKLLQKKEDEEALARTPDPEAEIAGELPEEGAKVH